MSQDNRVGRANRVGRVTGKVRTSLSRCHRGRAAGSGAGGSSTARSSCSFVCTGGRTQRHTKGHFKGRPHQLNWPSEAVRIVQYCRHVSGCQESRGEQAGICSKAMYAPLRPHHLLVALMCLVSLFMQSNIGCLFVFYRILYKQTTYV